jgi:transcriptional regulator with XRE-family HTH domain
MNGTNPNSVATATETEKQEAQMAMREIARLTLPERLRFHRHRRSLTLRQVSIASDVTESHLSQIERGEVNDPRLRTIMKIAEALEVPVEVLLKDLPNDTEQ